MNLAHVSKNSTPTSVKVRIRVLFLHSRHGLIAVVAGWQEQRNGARAMWFEMAPNKKAMLGQTQPQNSVTSDNKYLRC